MYYTIEAIKEANKRAGGHFFDASAMRFFRSRILPTVYQRFEHGRVLFITSEQFEFRGDVHPRKYSIAEFIPSTGQVERAFASEFQEFATAKDAVRRAKQILASNPISKHPDEVDHA